MVGIFTILFKFKIDQIEQTSGKIKGFHLIDSGEFWDILCINVIVDIA